MTRETLTRATWLRHQVVLWAVSLLGGGGLLWSISTQDWPVWVQYVLGTTVAALFIVGGPSTYRAYLREEQDRADYADLLQRGRSGVLSKCRDCGRHSYAEEANCVRCGVGSPIPDAAITIQSVRLLKWVGYGAMVSTAFAVTYLLVSALLSVTS